MDAAPDTHRPLCLSLTRGSEATLRTQAECLPCTAITHVRVASRGPAASGVRRGWPLRQPVVSSSTHHGRIPATIRPTGFTIRQ